MKDLSQSVLELDTTPQQMPEVPVLPDLVRLSGALIQRIGEDRYRFWFQDHTRIVRDGDTLQVGCRNQSAQDWLRSQFSVALQSAAEEVFGQPIQLQFTSEAKPAIPPSKSSDSSNRPNAASKDKVKVGSTTLFDAAETPPEQSPRPPSETVANKAHEGEKRPPTNQRRWRTLSEFIVGPCNRVAHATAQSIVEQAGHESNPLVIYGPCGTGKTHLLEGIQCGLRRRLPHAHITYVTAEEFLNRFVQMMKTGKQANFRRTFRECDALLIDDLSFLAGKRGSQEEFLHTFDALLAENRQVVVTLDSHPRLCDDLMEELVDRLLGGAIWSVLPPDSDTRFRILQAKSYQTNPPIPETVLKFLADKLRGNVRELEGALHGIRHFSRVVAKPVTLELAQEALGDLIQHAMRVVRIPDIESAVCDALRLPTGTLRSKQRSWAVSHPRMLAIYLSRKHTTATYGEISVYFGNKTHSTAVAAEKKVKQWLQKNEPLRMGERDWSIRDLIERIERSLQA